MSATPLKIAVISPVWFPVPPTGYGGIEWIVWLLADGLVEAGHEVAGVVEAVGSDVTYLAPGDHVIGCLSVFCGACPQCSTGHPNLCENTEVKLMPGQPLNCIGDAHSRNRDRSLTAAYILVKRSHSSNHVLDIQQRLAHAHKHDVANALPKIFLNRQHLIDNFVSG